jgi:hypothetical protein
MSSTKTIRFLSLLCILIKTTLTLPPVMCPSLCPEGHLVNPDCTCTEGKFCIALACPSMDQRRDHRNCQCVSKDDFLPYKPIVCDSTQCEPWEKMNSKCECESEKMIQPMPDLFPNPWPEPIKNPFLPSPDDLTVLPQKCYISKCDARFRFDKKSCSCKEWEGGICYIGCPPGQRVFAMPGRINCECTSPPKCRITQCAKGYDLINCKCKKHNFPGVKPIEPPISPPDDSILPICGIRRCHRMYELFRRSCECRLESLISCERLCPFGKMIKPGTCRCVKKPHCSIKSCRKGFRLNKKKCACIKRRKRKREYDY